MGARITWKKLIHDAETITYVKELGDYRVIIEARHYDDGWEIVKKYLGASMNFVETYSAHSRAELRNVLKTLRQEKDLSRSEIKDIANFKKKQLKVLVKRCYKEPAVEKWYFSINDNFSNFVTIRYGKDIDVDVVMEEQLKYIEEKVLARLYETLGLNDTDEAINQSIYYFTKKTTQYLEPDAPEIEFEFLYDE